MAAASRVAARLADLSHAQLLEIAVHGCERSPEVKSKADALIAKVARTTSQSPVHTKNKSTIKVGLALGYARVRSRHGMHRAVHRAQPANVHTALLVGCGARGGSGSRFVSLPRATSSEIIQFFPHKLPVRWLAPSFG